MRWLLPASVVGALLTRAGMSAAQSSPTGADTALQVTMGKALLEEGKRLLEAGHFKEAVEKLEASVDHDPTAEVLLAIATCQEKLGTTATAWGTLHRAEERARVRGDQARARQAAQRAAALDPKLSRLKVVVTYTDAPPAVMLDNRELVKDAWGIPLPLDPGWHTVAASAIGKLNFWKTFELPATESIEVTIPVLSPPPAPPASLPSPPPADGPRPENPHSATDAAVIAGHGIRGVPPAPDPVYHVPTTPLPPEYWMAPGSGHIRRRRNLESVGFGLFLGGFGTTLLAAGTLYVGAKGMSNNVVLGTIAYGAIGVIPGGIGGILMLVKPKNVVLRNTLPLDIGPLVAHSAAGLSLHGTF